MRFSLYGMDSQCIPSKLLSGPYSCVRFTESIWATRKNLLIVHGSFKYTTSSLWKFPGPFFSNFSTLSNTYVCHTDPRVPARTLAISYPEYARSQVRCSCPAPNLRTGKLWVRDWDTSSSEASLQFGVENVKFWMMCIGILGKQWYYI